MSGRHFHRLAALGLLACLCPTTAVGAGPRAVEAVGVADVEWTKGFWADRMSVCRDVMIPAMGEIMDGTKHSQFLENFRIAAGLTKGRHRGPQWNDGDLYKWLEAAAAVYAVSRDDKLDRRMDEVIAVLAKAQRSDGYLHTPVLIKNRNGDETARPFQDRLAFETYNFGHLFTAASVHHRATGKKSLLAVAVKAADFLRKAFANPSPQLARNHVCPSHYVGVIDLFRVTGDRELLELAKKFLALRDLVEDGSDDNQDRLPFRKQTEAVGHAVRANYLYAGVADLCLETGDEMLLSPLEKVWASVVRRKIHVTGGCGALYDGASPDGSKDQKAISRTHQAYGRDYQLPNSTAHNETCAAVGNVMWNWRMLAITGEARFADVLEQSLYNAVLAGVSLDGKRYFYTNTLRQLDAMPTLRWSRSREPFISCYCCPPNVARTIAQVSNYAYGRSERGLWVHLYGGNVLDTQLPRKGRLKLTQKTEYPWDGKVTLTIDRAPEAEFSLLLRVPGWSKSATLQVNGRAAGKASRPGSYAEVRRKWQAGDVVELTLPMPATLLEANPLVEEARNHVAVKRGPLVYCLETADLPKKTAVLTVAIPATATFEPRYDGKLLGGVTVLEGKARHRPEPAWGDELYREFRPAQAKAIDVRLVPYYAWGNRGGSEMTVWLPLGR